MANLSRYLRAIATVVLLSLLSTNIVHAQKFTPEFQTVEINSGIRDRCTVHIKYLRIVNKSNNSALTKINRANRIDAINEKAASSSDEIAVKGIATRMLDYYYDDMMNIPEYDASQTAHTVRNGKYVVFTTRIYEYMGGAHGYYCDKHSIYDLRTGDRLDLSYIATGSWEDNVKQQLHNRYRQKFGDQSSMDSYSNMPLPSTFELTDRGVAFVFQPYEIACYSMGIIRFEFTDAELTEMGVPIRW